MKTLVLADRPTKEKITSLLAKNGVELICTLGDLEQSSLEELRDIKSIPKLGVYGNHDSGIHFDPFGITNMHLRTFSHNGLTFGGFEGCVRYKDDPYSKMYTQEEATKLLEGFPYVDVMLVHCPPFGINDEPEELAHQGFKALRTYVEQKNPKYLLHGHTYPSHETLITKFGDTEIIYVYGKKIVKLTL